MDAFSLPYKTAVCNSTIEFFSPRWNIDIYNIYQGACRNFLLPFSKQYPQNSLFLLWNCTELEWILNYTIPSQELHTLIYNIVVGSAAIVLLLFSNHNLHRRLR